MLRGVTRLIAAIDGTPKNCAGVCGLASARAAWHSELDGQEGPSPKAG